MKRKKETARKRSNTIPVLDTRGLSLLSDILNSMEMLGIGSNLTLVSAGSFYDFFFDFRYAKFHEQGGLDTVVWQSG